MQLEQLVSEVSDYLLKQDTSAPYLFGVSGGQGAGKSTLCKSLTQALSRAGRRVITLALDDFYLPAAARAELAEKIHPLCATRGVPGTHDVGLLKATLESLQNSDATTNTPMPVFSKSHDDRLPQHDWLTYSGRPDIILLEGWCVGAKPAFIAPAPQTDWEHRHDPQGVWKKWTHTQAAAYEAIWATCRSLLLLRHINFDAVIDSRWIQEQGNARDSGVWQFVNRAEVAEFCAHYESWTLGIWPDLPRRADSIIGRDAQYDYHHIGD